MSVGGEVSNLLANGQAPSASGRGTVGKIRIFAYGDFGTGDAQVQMKAPDDVWQDKEAALTSDGEVVIDAPPGVQNIVRVNLTGSTSPDLDVWIQSALDL
jgi:hypothetical protein